MKIKYPLADNESYHPTHNWRQQTPAQQMIVIYQAMSGWHDNVATNITTPERGMANIKTLLIQMGDLLALIPVNHWKQVFPMKVRS